MGRITRSMDSDFKLGMDPFHYLVRVGMVTYGVMCRTPSNLESSRNRKASNWRPRSVVILACTPKQDIKVLATDSAEMSTRRMASGPSGKLMYASRETSKSMTDRARINQVDVYVTELGVRWLKMPKGCSYGAMRFGTLT